MPTRGSSSPVLEKSLQARIDVTQLRARDIARGPADSCVNALFRAKDCTRLPDIRANLREAESHARQVLGDIQAALTALDKE